MKELENFEENVVHFPRTGGERYDDPPLAREALNEDLDDPLESLLQEFEEISHDLEHRLYEKEDYFNKAIEELPKVTTQKILPEDILASNFSKALEFQTRIDLIHEVNKRIKYYIDELEMFLPKK